MKRCFGFHRGWWFIVCVLLTACLPSWADAPSERAARLAVHYGLDKPEGNGPFPAVMLVPACNGFNPRLLKEGRYNNAARRLKELGFAVIRVDYLAARGVSTCDLIMDPAELADDIVTATKYLRAQPFVKPDAINLMAWSYGGGAAFNALTKTESREPAQVAAVVAFYPYLALARPWDIDVPGLVLCGTDDTVAPCARFESLLAEVPTRARVKVVKYPESYHLFDNPEISTKVISASGNTIGYNEKATVAAWAEIETFLRR